MCGAVLRALTVFAWIESRDHHPPDSPGSIRLRWFRVVILILENRNNRRLCGLHVHCLKPIYVHEMMWFLSAEKESTCEGQLRGLGDSQTSLVATVLVISDNIVREYIRPERATFYPADSVTFWCSSSVQLRGASSLWKRGIRRQQKDWELLRFSCHPKTET